MIKLNPNLIKVFLIEDNSIDALVILETFKNHNNVIIEHSRNLQDSLLILTKENFDIILLDLNLPDSSELNTFNIVNSKFPDLPIVILTHNNDEETVLKALQCGAQDYLFKKYYVNADELIKTFRYSIERKKLLIKHEQMENALRKSEMKYRQLIENMNEGIWVIDKDSYTTFVNPSMAKMLGYSVEEMQGKHLFSFMDKNGIAIANVNIERRKQGIKELHDFEFIRKDGSRIYTILDTSPIRDDNGNYIGAIAGITDITKHKQTEDALRKSEKNYRILHESMMDGFVQTNMSGKIVIFNRSFVAMLGYSDEEILKKLRYKDLTPEHWYSFELEIINTQVLPRGYSDVYEKEYIRKDGTVFPAELRTYLIRDASGIPEGMWAIIRDITERKNAESKHNELEKQYLQAQKMEAIGRLSGGIAHDFNNMLSIILGYGELLLKKVDRSNSMYNDINEIIIAGRRSIDLINQLLIFARKHKSVPQIIDLNERIKNSEKMMRRLLGEDIDFKFIKGADLWSVKIDPSHIDQIIANLAVNSRDAIIGVGRMVIETMNIVVEKEFCANHQWCIIGEYVLISFSDNGCGMDKPTMERIFEPFFTTKGELGTGLGLSTIYGIINQNKGFIHVDSEPGKGTTFKIYIPRCDEKPKIESDIILINESLKGTETILLVEDEEMILHICKLTLEKYGYNVIAVTKPSEAIALAKKNQSKIHMLITDLIMPDMDGKELSEIIKNLNPDMQVLFMSAYPDHTIGHLNILKEEFRFIQKPFSSENLLSIIRKVLG
ncbi:MAG: PAS domain S-box protein [Desulfobacterales bacterium]|nr:PAS domain S-box protein [Desulfobacterales bacterium]